MKKTSNYAKWCLLVVLMAAMAALQLCSAATYNMSTAPTTNKPGCPRQCGNVTIPYPFGIGNTTGCSLNPHYDVFCNWSFTPPKPFLMGNGGEDSYGDMFEMLEISELQLRVRTQVASTCLNSSGQVNPDDYNFVYEMPLGTDSPFSYSPTWNQLIVIGCNVSGVVLDTDLGDVSGPSDVVQNSCGSVCSTKDEVVGGQCNGYGCCQAALPKRTREIAVTVGFDSTSPSFTSFNPCGYSFLAEIGRFTFSGLSDLKDRNFPSRVKETIPVAIDWVIGNGTCAEAQRNSSTYVCRGNATCSDNAEAETGIKGYKCFCKPGFQGNPYISSGCSDIDECADPNLHNCSRACLNTIGSFLCYCPRGYVGDGTNHGTGCTKQSSQTFILKLSIGVSSGILLLLVGASGLYIVYRNRKLIRMKEQFFRQNGGWLLQEKLSTGNFTSTTEPTKIFTEEELKVATKNFEKDCILGKGGYGTVYKGILPDNQVVAIKKSKVADQNQIEQFIHELVILTQINHRNVVKLLGCCLETEVPLLVYEFISKGTLYSHIHHQSQEEGGRSWRLTWSDCLKITSEVANALAYLHSAASPPIIHRDIKSMNILLDEYYTAKIADFGASRLIPMDQSQISTLVQGTIGYLDPEYFYSSVLTDKSDVYSFGVVLAELLTRQKPISQDSPEEDQNLATYFVRSMKQERLFDIVDRQWVEESSRSELVSMALLTQRCLALTGVDRPTMREVSLELEALKKNMKK